MLKKKSKVLILLIVALVAIIGIGIAVLLGGKEKEYPTNGNLKDNILDFAVRQENTETGTELSDAYLQSVNYKVVEIDEEKLVATIEVEVPDILSELEMVVDEAIEENPTMGYEELLPIVKENLQKFMKSEKTSTKTEQLEVAVEKVEDTYKLVPSDELRDLLYKDLETAYLEILLNGWEK